MSSVEDDNRILAEFSVPSQMGSERQAMDRVEAAVHPLNLPAPTIERLKTAVSEATLNAMEHGNQYQADLPVMIRVSATARALSRLITDFGSEMVSAAPEVPDLEAKLAGLQPPRGWGLFLIQNMVDAVHVTTEASHHSIELVINLKEERKR